MEKLVNELLSYEPINDMLFNARLDFAIEEEMSFVVAAAHLNGLMLPNIPFNKRLYQTLLFPIDDVAFVLRVFEVYCNIGEMRFIKFASFFDIDIQRFNLVLQIKNYLIKIHTRYCRGLRPQSFSTIIDAASNLFVKCLLSNPAVFVENNSFFDYNKKIFFEISPSSSVTLHPGIKFVRAMVYYRIAQQKNRFIAHFICVVPVRLTTELKYWKILHDKFLVGPIVGRRIQRNGGLYKSVLTDEDFIWLHSYDIKKGELSVLCTNNSLKKVKTLIQNEIKKTAMEMTQKIHRHFYIKQYKVKAIIAPGLDIFYLILNNYESDSLSFTQKHGNEFNKSDLRDLSRRLRKINKNATFTLFEEDGSHKTSLVATFPDVEEAELVRHRITSADFDNYIIKLYCQDLTADFFGRKEKTQNYCNIEVFKSASCAICLAVPNNDNYIRLGLCGHLFCGKCLVDAIKFSERFPLNCVFEGCAGSLVFDDIDVCTLLNRLNFTTANELNNFLEPIFLRSLDYFLRTSNCGFKKCMSLNCHRILNVPSVLKDYVFESTNDPSSLSKAQRFCLSTISVYCSGCKTPRCGLCGYSFHQGISCQEYYANNYVYNDETLVKWKKNNPDYRRICPNSECHILLEKSEGCNHMQCTMCGSHFCWLCEDFQWQIYCPDKHILDCRARRYL